MENKFTDIVTKLKNPSGQYTNQGEVYIALPLDHNRKNLCPLVIALHGSGRESLSYRDVPFYVKQRDIALKFGCVFAAVSNGPDTYGLDAGYENVEKLYEYMVSEYNVHKKIILWASSAGGLMMHRFYRENRDVCKLLLGIFPVFDPLTMPPINSMLKAFGADKAQELKERSEFLSPFYYPKDIYTDVNIVVAHGIDDLSVPIAQSQQFYKQVAESGGKMVLVKKPGGHSTENFALYDTPYFEKALADFKNSF